MEYEARAAYINRGTLSLLNEIHGKITGFINGREGWAHLAEIRRCVSAPCALLSEQKTLPEGRLFDFVIDTMRVIKVISVHDSGNKIKVHDSTIPAVKFKGAFGNEVFARKKNRWPRRMVVETIALWAARKGLLHDGVVEEIGLNSINVLDAKLKKICEQIKQEK